MDKNKFNEFAKDTISDKEYPEAGDVLKLVEGDIITDDHNRRLVDPSIFKFRGKPVSLFDSSYPVLDEKKMRGFSPGVLNKFQDYVNSNTGETITIDSIPEDVREEAEHDATLYGDSFVTACRPRTIYDYWIEGISDTKVEEPVVLEGITQSFKMNLKLAKLKKELDDLKKIRAIVEEHDVETFMQMKGIPDTMENRAFVSRFLWYWGLSMHLSRPHILNRFGNMVYFPSRCNGKKWFASYFDEFAKSISITSTGGILWKPETDIDLNSVIYMTWPTPDLTDLKAHDFRYGKMWEDQMLINYATGDVSPIDRMALEGLATFGPELMDKGILTAPNLNNNDKKLLERVIKKGRKRK